VSGLLNVRGSLGGSASAPTGVLHLKLLDGALGSQRLAKAAASLALNAAQQLSLDVQLAPADSHGHIKLAGSIDLAGDSSKQQQQQQEAAVSRGASRSRNAEGKAGSKRAKRTKASRDQQQEPQQDQANSTNDSSSSTEPHLALALNVKDGGMGLLTGLAPGITWGGGSAAVNLAASGPAAAPLVTGSASFSKGSLSSSFLRHPVTQLSGSLSLDGQRLAEAGLEARVGPKGALALRGSLPLTHASSSSSNGQAGDQEQPPAEGLAAGIAGIELRLRNMYSGSLDASLQVAGSLAAPQLGGRVVFSRGTAYLVPPAASGQAGGTAAGPAAAAAAAAGNSNSSSSSQLGQSELVKTAFAALKAGKARAALDQRVSQQVRRSRTRQCSASKGTASVACVLCGCHTLLCRACRVACAVGTSVHV
jgi:autotransporter translocation and assembly factor TamB